MLWCHLDTISWCCGLVTIVHMYILHTYSGTDWDSIMSAHKAADWDSIMSAHKAADWDSIMSAYKAADTKPVKETNWVHSRIDVLHSVIIITHRHAQYVYMYDDTCNIYTFSATQWCKIMCIQKKAQTLVAGRTLSLTQMIEHWWQGEHSNTGESPVRHNRNRAWRTNDGISVNQWCDICKPMIGYLWTPSCQAQLPPDFSCYCAHVMEEGDQLYTHVMMIYRRGGPIGHRPDDL